MRTVPSLLVTLLVIAFISHVPLWSQDVQVDRDELARIGDQSVRFINYVGPYEFTNTLDQIRGIGRSLGSGIEPGASAESSVGGKYRVRHIVSPDIPEGLDADIIFLEEEAAVDHIDNLRAILAGYLETAYGFSARDAYLVAEFVTYYNAVYRQDMAMVNERYKAPVGAELDPARVGIDTHYSNWPGKTQILIPLRGPDAPRVDTGAVSDEKVVEEMRSEEDRGLESRRDMVELREEELDEEQEELNQRREDVERQDEAVSEEIEELQSKEETEGLTAAETERQEELQEEQARVEEEKTAIEEQQQDIDTRTADVMRMRDEIAEDENALMDQESRIDDTFTSSEVTPMWFLRVDGQGDGVPFGRVVKYNLDNDERLAVSQITAVRGRTIVMLPDSILVIAGKEEGTSRVRPMLLDSNSLEVSREGTHDVFPGSLMTVQGSDIYLVSTENGEWRLGKFNTNLNRVAVSELAVDPWTSISFDKNSLFVQGEGGEILQLSTVDLREEARLQ